jgi:phosphate transport system protein
MQHDHTSSQFDTEMETLRSDVLAMGGLAERQLTRAIDALSLDDAELAAQVLADEERVNTMQRDIDQLCTNVIVRRQPAASDLRMVMTVVRTVNDLERIGDEAKKIARQAQHIRAFGKSSLVRYSEIRHEAELAREMLQLALDAYARLDVAAAADVIGRDREVDTEFQAIMRQLISYMMEDPRTISAVLDVVFIAKSIERIGDHAKNIAEYVVHAVKGKDVRHASAEEVQREAAS